MRSKLGKSSAIGLRLRDSAQLEQRIAWCHRGTDCAEVASRRWWRSCGAHDRAIWRFDHDLASRLSTCNGCRSSLQHARCGRTAYANSVRNEMLVTAQQQAAQQIAQQISQWISTVPAGRTLDQCVEELSRVRFAGDWWIKVVDAASRQFALAESRGGVTAVQFGHVGEPMSNGHVHPMPMSPSHLIAMRIGSLCVTLAMLCAVAVNHYN